MSKENQKAPEQPRVSLHAQLQIEIEKRMAKLWERINALPNTHFASYYDSLDAIMICGTEAASVKLLLKACNILVERPPQNPMEEATLRSFLRIGTEPAPSDS